jgi:phage terminase small subunit
VTPEQKQLFDKLTELQQRTAINVLAGMTQRAGYYAAGGTASNDESADATVSALLSNIKVKAFMDAMKEEAVSAAVMTRTEALEKLSALARTDLKDLVEFGEYELGSDPESGDPIIQSSWRIKPSALQDPVQMAAIAELTASKEGIKIKTHSPLAAIKQLSDMQGWNAAEKRELTGANGGPILIKDAAEMTDEELTALIANDDKG